MSIFLKGEKLNTCSNDFKIVFCTYRKNLVGPLLFGGGIGIILYAIQLILNGQSIIKCILLCIRSAIFYPLGAMWFIAACIVGSYILQCVLKYKVNVAIVSVISILLFVFALFSNTYYFLIQDTWYKEIVDMYLWLCVSARNGIFLFIYF